VGEGRGWDGILLQFGVPIVFHTVPIKFSIDYRPKVQEILKFQYSCHSIFFLILKIDFEKKN
jgi:hypothetical protein